MAPLVWLLWGKCQRNDSSCPFSPAVEDAEVITCEGIENLAITARGEKNPGKKKPPYHICHPAPSKTREGPVLPSRVEL